MLRNRCSIFSYWLKNAKAYCRYMKIKLRTGKSYNQYNFGNDKQRAIGSILMRMKIGKSEIVTEWVDLVSVNVPLFIVFEFLCKYKMYVKNVDNLLACHFFLELHVPLAPKNGHIYLEWGGNNIFLHIRLELLKLHRSFSHQRTEKLLTILILAKPD